MRRTGSEATEEREPKQQCQAGRPRGDARKRTTKGKEAGRRNRAEHGGLVAQRWRECRITSSRCNHAPKGRLGPSYTGHRMVPGTNTDQRSESRRRSSEIF